MDQGGLEVAGTLKTIESPIEKLMQPILMGQSYFEAKQMNVQRAPSELFNVLSCFKAYKGTVHLEIRNL